VRLWPRRDGAPEEAKADAVIPEHIWEQVLAAGDLSGGLGGMERAVGLPAAGTPTSASSSPRASNPAAPA
jgi:hypothetical protein